MEEATGYLHTELGIVLPAEDYVNPGKDQIHFDFGEVSGPLDQ